MSVRKSALMAISYFVLFMMGIAAIVTLLGLLYTYFWYLLVLIGIILLLLLVYRYVYLNRFKEMPLESDEALVYKY